MLFRANSKGGKGKGDSLQDSKKKMERASLWLLAEAVQARGPHWDVVARDMAREFPNEKQWSAPEVRFGPVCAGGRCLR